LRQLHETITVAVVGSFQLGGSVMEAEPASHRWRHGHETVARSRIERIDHPERRESLLM
jgi:hypothetical protein